MLDLLAQGLATSALRAARAEAEANLGRPLQHASEPTANPGPLELMKRRVLRPNPTLWCVIPRRSVKRPIHLQRHYWRLERSLW